MQIRLKYIRLFFLTAIFLIILRLGFWQIFQSDDLTARAESQRTLTQEISAPRGTVLFKDGSVLATSAPSFLVFAQPKIIDRDAGKGDPNLSQLYKKDFAKKVAPIFWEFDNQKTATDEASRIAQTTDIENNIFNNLNKNLFWVNLGRKVNVDFKQKLEKLNLIGMGFDTDTSRFYPESSSAAHLLGFVGSDDYGAQTGYFGVEGYYDGELKGQKGQFTQEKDALGLPILIGKFFEKEAKTGKTITLNVDRTVQHIVEENLKIGMQKYGAKGGSVVIMEPQTGNILAMASFPNYDPGDVLNYPKENFRNPITADGYEPGSTFKVLVMAAGINEGLVQRDTKCDICAGPLSIGGYSIRTWNNEYEANATMDDVIIHSDNTGMVFVGQKLGKEKLISYIKRFGFGDLTKIDLQDESSPALRADDEWQDIDLATASFGQGISATALQVVRAVGAIANGGKVMEPHVAAKISDGQRDFTIAPKVVDQPITPETAQKVTEMMVRAVNEGEAKFARVKGYQVAGKTGTAQIPVAGHYDANKTIASFVGFAPAQNPKFVMLVRYDEPSSSIYGAETAAPTFFNIARELFMYYGIPPTDE